MRETLGGARSKRKRNMQGQRTYRSTNEDYGNPKRSLLSVCNTFEGEMVMGTGRLNILALKRLSRLKNAIVKEEVMP